MKIAVFDSLAAPLRDLAALSSFVDLQVATKILTKPLRNFGTCPRILFGLLINNFLLDQKDQLHIRRKINSLLEFSWEELHLGPWKDVPIAWRDLYSIASILKAAVLYGST